MTPKQKRVYDYITSVIKRGEICPSYAEIMKALNISSKSIVAHYLNMLEKDGKIKINKGRKRGIEIIDENAKLKKIERLEKQLKIAVEALEFYEKPFACFHPDYNIAQHHKKAAEALIKIKELENKNKIFTYMGKPVDALTYIEKKIEYERKELER